MRNIVIASSFWLVFLYGGYGQIPPQELLNETWHLISVKYNGIHYSSPNDPNYHHILNFLQQNEYGLTTRITENILSASIEFDMSDYAFDVFNTSVTTFECDLYCSLEEAYFDFFSNEGLPKTLYYTLTVVDSSSSDLLLGLSDGTGNFASYYNGPDLSIDSIKKTFFDIYPIPATNILHINTAMDINNLSIFNISGELIMQFHESLETVDVSILTPGLYFFESITENGRTIKKFVKQ